MSPAIQAGWEKAAELLEIEERYMMKPKNTTNFVGENTIGVCILRRTKYAWGDEAAFTIQGATRELDSEDSWLPLPRTTTP